MQFKDNILQLPRAEAKALLLDGSVTLLYPFDAPKIARSNLMFEFDQDTESAFPAIAANREGSAFAENLADFKTALMDTLKDSTTRHWVRNAGRFWNYLGDGTHCSALVKTPGGLAVGDNMVAENRYNVDPVDVRVRDISLIRVQGVNSWLWCVTLEKVD